MAAIGLTAYVHFASATLQTMKTEAEAEMSRQMVAGQNFGMPGGRTRGGILFTDLMNHLAAINYALGLATGDIVDMTVGDCSAEL
jgi:hypothetical protein